VGFDPVNLLCSLRRYGANAELIRSSAGGQLSRERTGSRRQPCRGVTVLAFLPGRGAIFQNGLVGYNPRAENGPWRMDRACIPGAAFLHPYGNGSVHRQDGAGESAKKMSNDRRTASRRKIRLIEPRGPLARPLNRWITRWPMLGPITLASVLDEKGFDVQVYNENISGPLPENRGAYAEICSADVIGISIMTPTARRGYALAQQLRRDAPRATLVFGGIHASMVPEEALKYGDLVVCGEGELVIEDIAAGRVREGIIRAPRMEDLDALPTLNHSLMRDFEKVLAVARKKRLYELPVMTSRGCPHGCTYCTVTQMFGRRVRRQSVERVMRDLEHYHRLGYRHLFFYDDNFTADRDWSRRLLRQMEPLGMRFNAQVRVDFPWADRSRSRRDEDLLKAMKAGGCNLLFIGYETIDEATAQQWHKGYRGNSSLRQRLKEDTQVLHDQGFWIHAMFVMGPQHTRSVADQIVNFARECQLESLQISILTPFPGTEEYRSQQANLLLKDYPGDWDYYDAAHCVYSNAEMGLEGLQRAVYDAHDRFYRWYWNPRALRFTFARSISFLDKAVELWKGVYSTRRMLGRWRREIEEFLKDVRRRQLIP